MLDLVRTGVEVTSAAYDETTAPWHLETATGEHIDTDVLVTAVGQLSRPSIPHLPGIGTFTGPAFHSAEWDHDVDLRGKRIAVLGTGASAIQFVPASSPTRATMTVFQRSAPYVAPKPDREYTAHPQPRVQALPAHPGLRPRADLADHRAVQQGAHRAHPVRRRRSARLAGPAARARSATPSCARS